MSANTSIQVLVLAAGAGTRFGSAKQLAPVNGVPMLRLALNRALSLAGAQVSVVIGAHAGEVAPVLGRLAVNVVVNRQWEEGMSSSIRAGLASVPGSVGGVLLLLADQVGVSEADLQRLCDAWRRSPNAIVAAQYGGGHGVPALFPRSQFALLHSLRGERGARALLRGGGLGVLGVPMPSAAHDIDTRAELDQYAASLQAEAGERATGATWRGPTLALDASTASGEGLELDA
jgi:molybdenum cofactor cytidylyltransferase